jgi:hypothetical protein
VIVALEQRFLDGGEAELANGRGVPSRLLFLRTKRSHCRKGRRRLICRSEKAGVGLRRERGERRERSRKGDKFVRDHAERQGSDRVSDAAACLAR